MMPEYKIFAQPPTTNLVAITLPLLAASLLPVANHSFPQQSASSYRQNAPTGGQYYSFAEAPKEQEQVRIFQSFAVTLFNDMKDMDADIAKITNDKFWDMYEQF